MVTASHNPKQDNGYKVYWSNGCQIIPPHDKGIATAIENNLEPWQTYDIENIRSHPLVENPIERISSAYFEQSSAKLCRHPDQNASSDLKIVYTAMHGIGTTWTSQAFEAFHLKPDRKSVV